MILKVRKLHKWLGVVIGLQLLLWTASGVYFAWIPIDEVRGRHQAARAPAPLEPGNWVAPGTVVARTRLAAVHAVELKSIGGIPLLYSQGRGWPRALPR